MSFDFSTSRRIIFGNGILQQVGGLASGLGQRVLIITGQGGANPATLVTLLQGSGLVVQLFSVSGEPDLETIQLGIQTSRDFSADLFLGFGGGSAIDSAKAIAAFSANPGDPLDYLEVVGRGLPLLKASLPVIAIPTTAGTGSEVTRNAVISLPEHRIKVSLRHSSMLPSIALVDPDLTLSLPPEVTAATGMDALTQLIEPFLSTRANELTDLFCLEGMVRVSASLVKAVENGTSLFARTDMSYASLLGGLALANAGLGAVHGLAAPIGGMFHAPHGAICACLLPLVFQLNWQAVQASEKNSYLLSRFHQVGKTLLGDPHAGAPQAIEWLLSLRDRLKIPGLSHYGVTSADLSDISRAAMQASSMKSNPIQFQQNQFIDLLSQAL